jgi:intracellular sulfur oxidation DsrE/DsrF family protein
MVPLLFCKMLTNSDGVLLWTTSLTTSDVLWTSWPKVTFLILQPRLDVFVCAFSLRLRSVSIANLFPVVEVVEVSTIRFLIRL